MRVRGCFFVEKILFCAAVRENGGKKAVWKEGRDGETNLKTEELLRRVLKRIAAAYDNL